MLKILIALGLVAVPSIALAFIAKQRDKNESVSFVRESNVFIFPEDNIVVNTENIKFTSNRGKQLIKNKEGLRLSVYLDPAGLPTIGYGHLILPDETFTDDITIEEAETLLKFDLIGAERCITNTVTETLNQNQFDALVSFVFNIGCDNFETSTLLKKLNSGDVQGASNELERWKFITVDGEKVISNGLISRRAEEKNLFLA